MESPGWSCDVQGDVLVFEFEAGMDRSEFEGAVWDAYTARIDRHDVSGLVTVVRIDDPFDAATFEVWRRSGRKAVEEGISKWVVVADGLKSLSLKSHLDVPGLEVHTTDTRDEAIEWVRS